MEGELIGGCNCAWGCPCNFDALPTYGNCDGAYVYYVREGRFGDVSLDGLKYVFAGSSPGAVHEGHGTSLLLVDEAAMPEQRAALETLWRSGESGLPFDIWNAVTETWLDTIVTPIEFDLDGMKSRARVGDGLLELAIARVRNPVTDDDEELYLDKPTGFTSKRSELGNSLVFRVACDGLRWDHSGRYAEHAKYRYSGPA